MGGQASPIPLSKRSPKPDRHLEARAMKSPQHGLTRAELYKFQIKRPVELCTWNIVESAQ